MSASSTVEARAVGSPLAALVDQLSTSAGPATNRFGLERRGESRYPVSIPVVVRSLDDQFNPVGPAMTAITRDISYHGMSLILPYCRFGNLLVHIVIASEVTSVVLEVKHCSVVNDGFLIGGRVTPWSTAG